METQHHLKLIDGNFTPEEANEILLDLIASKIRHHNLKILSIKEHSNGDVSHSEKRIEKLKKVNQSLKKIITYAQQEKLHLKVESFIQVELVNEPFAVKTGDFR